MATTALRYCVLSLLCRVGFAEMAEQQNCFVVEHDEIELNFSAATLRSNNLGGMGPGPSECNDALSTDHQNQSFQCGFHDLDDTHPYYRKMVFGNVVSAATSARLGGVVDLVISNTTEYSPYTVKYNGLNEQATFGMLNVKTGSIDHVTLKFELHLRPPGGEEGPKTPILMPYVKFSLFDFDEAVRLL